MLSHFILKDVISCMYWVAHFVVEKPSKLSKQQNPWHFCAAASRYADARIQHMWQAKINDNWCSIINFSQLPAITRRESMLSDSHCLAVFLCCLSVRRVLNWSRWHSWVTHDACSCSLIVFCCAVGLSALIPSLQLLFICLCHLPLFLAPSFHLCCTFNPYGCNNSVRVAFKEETVTNSVESKVLQALKERDCYCV